MPTANEIRNMVRRRGFSPDANKERYILNKNHKAAVLDIYEESDGSFSVVYVEGDPSEIIPKLYDGDFGPKGGARNYGARKILEILSK